MKIKDGKRTYTIYFRVGFGIGLLMLSACGSVKAGSARAEFVPSPTSGISCFIIYDNDGKAVGGNCLQSQ